MAYPCRSICLFPLFLALGLVFLPVPPLRAADPAFDLQVSSCKSEDAARKEATRLKGYGLKAKIFRPAAGAPPNWYTVQIGPFTTREEARARGLKLRAKNIIKNFIIIEQPIAKKNDKKSNKPPAALMEAKPLESRGRKPLLEGSLRLEEEPQALRLGFLVEPSGLPEVRSEKRESGSHIFLQFRNRKTPWLPLEFQRREGLLRRLTIRSQGNDCTITLVLNPEFNYEVAQDYYEQEMLYTLLVNRVP